jgi:phosphonopyruvate decarboxylase
VSVPVSRSEGVDAVMANLPDETVVVSSTGFLSREVADRWDRPRNFYMLGSMGLATPIALGIALTRPGVPVVVIEGDGSALMGLAVLPSVAALGPRCLTTVIVDSGGYDSTGGQRSPAPQVAFAALARAAGYRAAAFADDSAAVRAWMTGGARDGPSLLHIRVAGGSTSPPARVSLGPVQIADRCRRAVTA